MEQVKGGTLYNHKSKFFQNVFNNFSAIRSISIRYGGDQPNNEIAAASDRLPARKWNCAQRHQA